MSELVMTAVITGLVSSACTFVSLAAYLGRKFDRLEETLDRKSEMFAGEVLRPAWQGHPPNAAA